MRSKHRPDGLTLTEQVRREQIIGCAIASLAEDGYAGTSISSVAARAGIAKSVVLYHFTAKRVLLEAVVDSIHAVAGPTVLSALEQCTDDRQRLLTYIRQCCLFADEHRSETAALTEIYANLRSSDGSLRYGPETDRPMVEFVAGLLQDGQRAGHFDDFDPAAMAISIRSAIDGLPRILSTHPDINGSDFAEHLATVFDRATARHIPE